MNERGWSEERPCPNRADGGASKGRGDKYRRAPLTLEPRGWDTETAQWTHFRFQNNPATSAPL